MHQDDYVRMPRAALRSKRIPPSAKLVFAALQGYAWGDKEEAWPSIARLAADTDLNERTVRYALRKLEEAKYITTTRRKDPNNPNVNTSSLYSLSYVGKDGVVYADENGGLHLLRNA